MALPALTLRENKSRVIARHFNFDGIASDFTRKLYDELDTTYRIFKFLKPVEYITGSYEYRQLKKEFVGGKKIGRYNAFMSVHYGPDFPTHMAINEHDFSPENYAKSIQTLIKTEKDKRHPASGGNVVKRLINHEIGHVIQIELLGSKCNKLSQHDEFIARVYRQFHSKKNPERMTQALSSYANKNIFEFCAEAWSEYVTSPAPRELATIIGDRLVKLYVCKFFQTNEERKEQYNLILEQIEEHRKELQREATREATPKAEQAEITATTPLETHEKTEEEETPTPEEKTQEEPQNAQKQEMPKTVQPKQQQPRKVREIEGEQLYFNFNQVATPKPNYIPNAPNTVRRQQAAIYRF